MKTFNEWQHQATINENPEVFIEKIAELTHLLEDTLRSFHGEKFEGFLGLVGTVNNLKRALIDIQNGTESTPVFSPPAQAVSEAKQVAMEKVNFKDKKSSGSRDMTKDLSDDYKGNIKKFGTVGSFKVVKKIKGTPKKGK